MNTKDELSHLTLFKHIISAIAETDMKTFALNSDVLLDLVKAAVEQEKEWVTYAYSDVMSVTALHKYIEHIADKRVQMLGFNPIYGVAENPIPFVDRFQDMNGVKTDFFEERPKNYTVASVDLSELDDLDF